MRSAKKVWIEHINQIIAKFVKRFKMVIIIKKGATKDEIRSLLEAQKSEPRKGVDIKKYCGIIQLREDPLKLQKTWRNEWE